MQCEEARDFLLEMIYEREMRVFPTEFKRHFSECRSCSTEYLSLLETREVLTAWKDRDVPERLMFPTTLGKRKSWWEPFRFLVRVPALSYGFLFMLMVLGMAFARVQVSWGGGKVAIQSAWLSPAISQEKWVSDNRSAPEEIQVVMEKAMAATEVRQSQQTLAWLQKAIETMDYRRQMDIMQLSSQIETLQQAYYRSMEKNSALLEQNVKFMNQVKY